MDSNVDGGNLAALAGAYQAAHPAPVPTGAMAPPVDWVNVLLAGLVAGVGMYLLVAGGTFVYKLWAYRHGGYRHEDWQVAGRLSMEQVSGVLFASRSQKTPLDRTSMGSWNVAIGAHRVRSALCPSA